MSQHSGEPTAIQKEELDLPRINGVAQKFLDDLNEERERLGEAFPLCSLLIDLEFDRVYSTGRIPGREYHADVYRQKPMKITQKVFVPVKQYPKFNFTGKILGPKGNSLRRLEEETQCKIAIKGRNSIRDRIKEEQLRNSGDPRYAHLNNDLFVEISAIATPAESYARIAYALAEIRKYLVPDKNDEVSHEQLRELMEIDPQSAKQYNKSIFDKKKAVFTAPKYQGLKRHSNQPEKNAKDEIYEYEARPPKRPPPPVFEHPKARPIKSSTPYKRPTAPIHGTDFKRIREAPIKSYKRHPYGKYK